MWTYSPQKRQDDSVFALTYRLLLRACKLMGVFIIHPCLPSCWSLCTSAGPLRFTDITPLHRYYWPLRHPLVFHRFLGSPVIRLPAPPISRRDEEGFSSCLAHPCHRAAANTPPECPTASVSCGGPCCLRPFGAGSAPGVFGFRGHLCVYFRCGPMTSSPSQGWLCRSASFASFPPRMRS